MELFTVATDDHMDEQADVHIAAGLSLEKPTSFFLFADAGSGKTRSLVNALDSLREKHGSELRLHGRRVGVITYTNAACDEIIGRLKFDPLFEVSTIHSFVWSLIKRHNKDIKDWLRANLASEILELEKQQQKGRPGTKAATTRQRAITGKQERLLDLENIRTFIYSPTGENRERNSLSHSEVIKIGSDLLTAKPTMQQILVAKFPVLLIDESQDTNKLLMEALLKLQAEHKPQFCLGLFGDVMQRIYGDGKVDLGRDVPTDWAKPVKQLNHRCPRRIVALINKIRSYVDGHVQLARSDSEVGFARLFIYPQDVTDKGQAEDYAAHEMASVTKDALWSSSSDVKKLVLEHQMAANRLGFGEMFGALSGAESLQTGLRDGSLPGVRLFSQLIWPLVQAKREGNEFKVASIVRRASPLLSKEALRPEKVDQRANVRKARAAIDELMEFFSGDRRPRFLDVLNCVARTHLFQIPESLRPFVLASESRDAAETTSISLDGEDEQSDVLKAWEHFLLAPFSEIGPYDAYVSGRSPFATHQGVKGLEFPRVMVVVDDSDAGGFMFSYEKLFGAKDKTKADIDNEAEGKDTGIDRTRRLFYVTCSRAKKSLAIVAYSGNPQKVREYVIREGWFDETEVRLPA